MSEIILIVDAEASPSPASTSPAGSASATIDLPTALRVIQPHLEPQLQAEPDPHRLRILTSTDWPPKTIPEAIPATLLPLTFNLPVGLAFAHAPFWQQCQNPQQWAVWVSQAGGQTRSSDHPPQPGRFWLPIVLTARGPLYGEVIGPSAAPARPACGYQQPIHLPDQWRQPLYGFGYRLLQTIAAPPSVYLLEFGWQDQPDPSLVFDRLWPFPNQAALASLGVQTHDLLTCYWRCVAGLPITDLLIAGSTPYQALS
jgi:hypothetical protein